MKEINDKYISFREQLINCEKIGNMIILEKICFCKKYNTQCKSSVCLKERILNEKTN